MVLSLQLCKLFNCSTSSGSWQLVWLWAPWGWIWWGGGYPTWRMIGPTEEQLRAKHGFQGNRWHRVQAVFMSGCSVWYPVRKTYKAPKPLIWTSHRLGRQEGVSKGWGLLESPLHKEGFPFSARHLGLIYLFSRGSTWKRCPRTLESKDVLCDRCDSG
jgi:hypothetical protein